MTSKLYFSFSNGQFERAPSKSGAIKILTDVKKYLDDLRALTDGNKRTLLDRVTQIKTGYDDAVDRKVRSCTSCFFRFFLKLFIFLSSGRQMQSLWSELQSKLHSNPVQTASGTQFDPVSSQAGPSSPSMEEAPFPVSSRSGTSLPANTSPQQTEGRDDVPGPQRVEEEVEVGHRPPTAQVESCNVFNVFLQQVDGPEGTRLRYPFASEWVLQVQTIVSIKGETAEDGRKRLNEWVQNVYDKLSVNSQRIVNPLECDVGDLEVAKLDPDKLEALLYNFDSFSFLWLFHYITVGNPLPLEENGNPSTFPIYKEAVNSATTLTEKVSNIKKWLSVRGNLDRLIQLHRDLFKDVTRLNLVVDPVPTIPEGIHLLVPKLSTLRITTDCLGFIHPDIQKCTDLTELCFKNTGVSYLSRGCFRQLRHLRQVNFYNTPLVTIGLVPNSFPDKVKINHSYSTFSDMPIDLLRAEEEALLVPVKIAAATASASLAAEELPSAEQTTLVDTLLTTDQGVPRYPFAFHWADQVSRYSDIKDPALADKRLLEWIQDTFDSLTKELKKTCNPLGNEIALKVSSLSPEQLERLVQNFDHITFLHLFRYIMTNRWDDRSAQLPSTYISYNGVINGATTLDAQVQNIKVWLSREKEKFTEIRKERMTNDLFHVYSRMGIFPVVPSDIQLLFDDIPKLTLRWCDISFIHPDIAKCEGLESLIMYGNRLHLLPFDALRDLQTLTLIDISENPEIKKFITTLQILRSHFGPTQNVDTHLIFPIRA
ncbi:MAG: hypothetical protein A3F09_00695 [Chlamydiae bacterium RIFCSPHIGHO2_12_FULL_49_11]|nr:MAG: hypothetical protein A3F09_00695 [Chlamydiae bacterium RIFCSPHIGHO2_12_FULL_49_11]